MKEQIQFLYSKEAEDAVIGCMLSQPAETIAEVRNYPLEERDFFVPANKDLYRVLMEMDDENQSIDVMTVRQWLSDRKMAERVGSPGCLADYLTSFATHLNIMSYVKIVRDKRILRDTMELSKEMAKWGSERPDDVQSILAAAQAELNNISDGMVINQESDFGLEIEEAGLAIIEHAASGGGLKGLSTGFDSMDQTTLGWGAGQVTIIAARPGIGKTSFAQKLIMNLVQNRYNETSRYWDIPGYAVQFFSMEMTREELFVRWYAMQTYVGLTKIIKGELDPNDRDQIAKAQAWMRNWKLFIDDTPRMDADLIRSRAKRAARKHNIDLFVVDYLQLATSRKYPKDRQNEVAYISATMKQIAKETGKPVVVLAQLNRQTAENKDEKPALHHIKDSGAVEADADKVILLHRDNNADRIVGKAPLQTPGSFAYTADVAKHRNGPTGPVLLSFEAWRVNFLEYLR